jgi:glycosyltransferase involved in cell wall biosynthesis
MWSPYGVTVARAAMAAGIPTLVTVHSMWAGAGGIPRLAARTSLRRWPVAWSAVSDAAAETFRRSLGGTDVAVLPNAIDVAAWRPAQRAWPHHASVVSDDEPITLVSVMRLVPRKRPLPLLKMFVEVRRLLPERDLRLVIVGDGPLRRRAERYVRRHGLCEDVRITGRLPRRRVLDELRASLIYVAPAPKESFGIAALEARCTGLPVIGNRHSGVSEFIRDRIDGMLVADDTELVVAIAELISNPELRQKISTHNSRVAPRHDWSATLDRTDELYRKAAERVGSTTPGRVPTAAPITAGA